MADTLGTTLKSSLGETCLNNNNRQQGRKPLPYEMKGEHIMYKVTFTDRYGYKTNFLFWGFEAAASFWQSRADWDLYTSGELVDEDTLETVWKF